MIIKYSDTNENRIYWQHRRDEEWKTAELDELIEAYERATEPDDLISRAEAIRMYCGEHCGCEPSECGLTHEQDGTEACAFVWFLKSVPSAEKTGRWLDTTKEIGWPRWTCSACGGDGRGDYMFCPWCGARMEEE